MAGIVLPLLMVRRVTVARRAPSEAFAGEDVRVDLLAKNEGRGASLSVANAYIADITPPEKRTQKMGLIGMAFGFGFIFGPALGAFSFARFGLPGPGWAVGCADAA